MAPQRGKRVAGGFLNLKELVHDQGPTLVMFRILEFLEPEKATTFNGWNYPVIADARILDGKRAGELWESQKFFGAIGAPLRGVPNAKDKKDQLAPEVKVGEEPVLRVKLVHEGKPNEGAVGDSPSDAEFDTALKFYEENGGETGFWSTPVPVAVAAGGDDGEPW